MLRETAAMDRRSFLRSGLVASAAFTAFGSSFWRSALASHTPPVVGATAYGPLGAPDAHGLRLPQGFTAREVARSGTTVPGTLYAWHDAPDGGATFAKPDGGWIYVSNSELSNQTGGVGALSFAPDGSVLDAYRILGGTSRNCAGGPTPWGTWLSCEETDNGLVWECDPAGIGVGIPRPALGAFSHEAAAVDPQTLHVYLTEDRTDGRFYRFTPDTSLPTADPLASGKLEAARVESNGSVTWHAIPLPVPAPVVGTATRHQAPLSTRFSGGEGIWFDEPARTVYFATKGDATIWAYDVEAKTMEILFSSNLTPTSPMNGIDNIIVSPAGEIFVCEDHSSSTPLEMILVSPADGVVGPFIELTGAAHSRTELAGVAFDPSGTRMYFSSQRGYDRGVTYEITGPFRDASARG